MTSPIEQYLGQLRMKLESRFESECADQVLSEIRAHLVDAAEEFELEGMTWLEAERLSVQKFGTPEKASFLLPLGKQFGTGDRYWGWAAFGTAVAAAIGVALLAALPSLSRVAGGFDLKPIAALALAFYAYACWRARSFAMMKQSAAVIGLLVLATGLARLDAAPRIVGDFGRAGLTAGLQAFDSRPTILSIPGLPRTALADLGIPGGRALPLEPGPQPSGPSVPTLEGVRIPGMASIGQDPWELAGEGLLPAVSQLLLSWLFFILMANGAVCWIGCLEHEQKGGVALLQ